MEVATTYLNGRIEFFEAEYGPEQEAQYSSLAKLYNPVIGPVKAVGLYRPGRLDLSMYGTSCHHTPTGRIVRDLVRKSHSSDIFGIPIGGKGADMRPALLSNLGEASERLLAGLHSSVALDHLQFATYAQLLKQGKRALGPSEIPLFAAEQYRDADLGFVPFEADTPLWWLSGHDLLTGESVMAPAQLTLFYSKPSPAEPRIGYATSGGLVFHTDRRRAILHGIYENIERDAINLRWYGRMPPLRVNLDVAEFLKEYAGLRRPRMSTPYIDPVTVFVNTLDIPIPIFTAITIDHSRQKCSMLAGGGAWSGKERALLQALFEIGQARTGFNLHPHAWDHIKSTSRLSELTDFYYAPVYYGYAENLPKMNWYMKGTEVVDWNKVPTTTAATLDEEYEEITGWLAEHKIHPILFDFSTGCWPGVFVTKVYMPQLTFAHIPSHPYFGHPRYYELPKRIGMYERGIDLKELLRDPLPFP